ncbi:MAG: D-aminoacyl-tRNA deacylase [Chloroflexi bacterium]|jgi:D-tyrosyl-tRNA(Tyr) deacylase|nr:D-aminoacyl-tRNA deacylase [Chloroflexota bacterium]
MRALLQRVARAEVRVDGRVVGSIGRGLVVLLGVGVDDDEQTARALARRIVELRIHQDGAGRTNLDLVAVGGAVLAISQFTLYADTRRGRRPGFTDAAPPEAASRLYECFCEAVTGLGIAVERGVFGALMQVELVNEGPMTIWLDSADRPG